MSAGRNIAIGCGVIILAISLAGFLGYKWVKDHFGLTTDDAKINAWSVEMIGTTPPPEFTPLFGVFATEKSEENPDKELREAVIIYSSEEERGAQITLTIFSRIGVHDLESAFKDLDDGNEGMKVKLYAEIGEPEDYTASWRDQEIPVRLWEGYADEDDAEVQRNIAGLVPIGEMTVVLLFQGPGELVNRDAVQEMLDRIPVDWQPAEAVLQGAGG
ncbi:MAG: hypothetical protein GY747_11435 [Planctomycetes bacterium]|nr:hypothetical protein [Planctomycetota bacterium]MCP4772243.1 hypothetical protein [Planctomycetota bacterium]MCP4861299.1 hypothetical protein [Planctomycetota bacterium]